MSTAAIVAMFGTIVVGFVLMVLGAAGYRKGWPQRVWIGLVVAAFVFLTVIPVVMALTWGLSPTGRGVAER